MTGSYTLSFREAAQVPESAGQKGASLGRLTTAGFRVPAGFVLSGIAYADFARAVGIERLTRRLADLHPDPFTESALHDLARVRLACLRMPLPETVRSAMMSALAQSGIFGLPLAVRGSVACEEPSEAGFERLHGAALNVLGFDALEAAIRACWAGLWRPHAVAYRGHAGVSDRSVSMAAIIQRLVPADAAGVAFTRDPEANSDAVVIRAAWGLGEGVSSGRVEPDRFLLVRDAGGLILVRTDPGAKAEAARPAAIGGIAWQSTSPDLQRRLALTSQQATAIAETCGRIEQALGGPQVIEWARVGDDISLLQTRPLAAGASGSRAAAPDHLAPGASVTHPRTHVWSRALFTEALPAVPTPLTWSTAQLLTEQSLRLALDAVDRGLPAITPTTRRLHGRPYLDVAALEETLWNRCGIPPESVRRAAGIGPDALPTTADSGRGRRVPLGRHRRLLRLLWTGWRAGLGIRSRLQGTGRRLGDLEKKAPGSLSELGLLEASLANTEIALSYLPDALLAGSWSLAALLGLEDILRRRLGPDDVSGLVGDLLARRGGALAIQSVGGLRGVARAAAADPEARALLERCAGREPGGIGTDPAPVEAFLQTRPGDPFAQLLRRFGHHALVDGEIAQATWSEDVGYLLRGAASYLAHDPPPRGDPRARARAAWATVRGRLGLWDRFRCCRRVAAVLKGMRIQEAVRETLARQVALERRLSLEIGTRLVGSRVLDRVEDVFFLKAPEIHALLMFEELSTDVRALVTRRKRDLEEHSHASAPEVIVEESGASALRSSPLAGVLGGEAPADMDIGAGPLVAAPPAAASTQQWPPTEGSLSGSTTQPASGTPAGSRCLAGIGVSGGQAVGRACVLHSADEGWGVGPDEILVVQSPGLAWAPHILRAGGVVLEGGGFLSLGARVAREGGIPAVAGVAGATQRIPNGTRVSLDGDHGLVELLD